MADKKYVLLKWKDGWQEVMAVEDDAIDFDKYYVIERAEHFGRLVIKRPKGEYPGLIVIDRAPMEIEEIALVGGDGKCNLKQTSTYREGDRLEYNYELQKGQGDFAEEVSKDIKKVLAEKGISAKDLLSRPDSEKIKEFESIRKAIHLVAGKKQEDVIRFIQVFLEKVA
jgi:hypothetical protein